MSMPSQAAAMTDRGVLLTLPDSGSGALALDSDAESGAEKQSFCPTGRPREHGNPVAITTAAFPCLCGD
jgi:hypothetical protein